MARLIDADEAKANIITFATECGSTVLPIDAILMILNSIDTVDSVEVVRCWDCKHRYSDSWCEYVDDDDNFYCARGERKEGADND